MRQGLLSEPEASSGPAAMLLAVSRSPSSIPRRSPCPERCHLPLVSLNHIHISKPQKHPRVHPPNDVTFLWRPSPSFSQNLKNIPDCIHRTMPPSSGVPRPHPYTQKKSPASSYSKDTGLPSVIYKLEMRLELTTPSLRVKCSTD